MFKQNYKFVDGIKAGERKKLEEELADEDDPERIKQIKYLIQRYVSRLLHISAHCYINRSYFLPRTTNSASGSARTRATRPGVRTAPTTASWPRRARGRSSPAAGRRKAGRWCGSTRTSRSEGGWTSTSRGRTSRATPRPGRGWSKWCRNPKGYLSHMFFPWCCEA